MIQIVPFSPQYADGVVSVILPIQQAEFEIPITLDAQPDLKDIPKIIKQELKIHLAESMDEVLKIALTRELPPKPPREKPAIPSELAPGGGEGDGPGEPPLTH